jgi:hypothetical protein
VTASILRRQLEVVYHFVPLRYLANVIRRNGLWCRHQLLQWEDDFESSPQKWGSVGKAEAFKGYVSCSVNPPMGMLTKKNRPVLLELRASVAADPGVVFIGRLSSYADVKPADAVNQTGVEWFDRMFLNQFAGRAVHPGEFLVPLHIPLSAVKTFVFYSQHDLDDAKVQVRGVELPPGVQRLAAVVKPASFGRKMQQEAE